MNATFEALLAKAVQFHGHLCGGQVLGVRMAIAGLRELGIDDPQGKAGRDLVIFVEIDRCATDAIIAVTGRTPGKRGIKMLDYGKMAATFVDSISGRAVRVSARGDSNDKVDHIARTSFPDLDEKNATLEALKRIPENDLFRIREVAVTLLPQDLPGRPLSSAICQHCGEMIKDMREVRLNGKILCKPCAQGTTYYTEAIPLRTAQETREECHESARH